MTGLTRSTSLDGRKYDIACGQIDIGNAETDMTAVMKRGVPQPNGSIAAEPTFDVEHVAQAGVYMANLPLDAKAVDEFRIAPNPFTPNGDGINDETEILFSVFKLTAPRQARVRVYTLAGRQMWEHAQMLQSGRVSMLWDGTDLNGRKVPPGLYICQVNLDTDRESRSATRMRLLSVAY